MIINVHIYYLYQKCINNLLIIRLRERASSNYLFAFQRGVLELSVSLLETRLLLCIMSVATICGSCVFSVSLCIIPAQYCDSNRVLLLFICVLNIDLTAL